jgi:carbamoyltransferase
MVIVGISGFGHDSAAAIMVDGELVAACEEERLSRVKHDGSFPEKSIAYCLAEAGIEKDEVDYVAFYHDPWLHMGKRLRHVFVHLPRSVSFLKSHGSDVHDWWSMFSVAKRFPRATLEYVEHHLAHAASAFYTSRFSEAAVLSIDGMGEWDTTLLGFAEDTKIVKLDSIEFPHSLGIYYEALTQYLGFRIHNDEYKVMGLSAYGSDAYLDAFSSLVRFGNGGHFELDLSMFAHHLGQVPFYSGRFVSSFGAPRRNGDRLHSKHADIAWAGQRVLELAVLKLVRRLFGVTDTPNLCIAGGVGLNCVVNGKLIDGCPFDNIHIQPASYDSGCAIGCCYYVNHSILGRPRKKPASLCYVGPRFDNSRIERALRKSGVCYERTDRPETDCARMLAAGKLVGWFQGRMEFGPRALGARSILADPTRRDMKSRVNLVKDRENFRPFAPSVLEDRTTEYFDMNEPSPYMLFARKVREGRASTIPSVTHVDGTARLQTVSRERNPRFYELISEFDRLTGVPVVLNTSLNVRGEPIACTPEDALGVFMGSGLDGLFLGNYLVRRR